MTTPLSLLLSLPSPSHARFIHVSHPLASCMCGVGVLHLLALMLAGARQIYGSTPLHLAVSAGHLALATLLVQRGADVEKKDVRVVGTVETLLGAHGMSRLLVLPPSASLFTTNVLHGRLSVCSDAQAYGTRPVALACKERHFDIAVMLAKHGATVDAVSACPAAAVVVSLLQVYNLCTNSLRSNNPSAQALMTTLRKHCSSL